MRRKEHQSDHVFFLPFPNFSAPDSLSVRFSQNDQLSSMKIDAAVDNYENTGYRWFICHMHVLNHNLRFSSGLCCFGGRF